MIVKELLKNNYRQLLFVYLAFLAMIFVSYFYVSGIVREQMRIIGDTSMDSTQTSVSDSLMETELLFASIVQTVEGLLSTGKHTSDVLYYLKETNDYFSAERSPLPDFMKIYAYIRGEWLDGSGWVPPAGYVPEHRPWHIGAEGSNGRIFFSEPYLDADTGGMCITFSQKLFGHDGKSFGILAVDLKLSRITQHVRDQRIAGNGYGVLIDNSAFFTVHRNPDLVGKKVLEAGGDYARLDRLLGDGESISAVRFKDADGTDSVVFFRTIFNGWHIGIIIPRISYYREVFILAGVLSAMGLILATVLAALLLHSHAEKARSDEENLSKSNFLARMSHEMRTPMNAIIGMASIARNSADPEKKEYCLGRICDASTHLLGIINDVLDMSKIEAGKLELSEADFAFNDLIRQVETVVNFKIEEKRQNFRIQVDEQVPESLVADRQRLAQVITNLLSNANKFTPENGNITLGVHRLPDEGRFCVLQFVVEDDGIGISEAQQTRLFHSFEQADGSISRKYGGTGLGLAISKKIAELMGGTICVESSLGRGSRFIVTIHVLVGSATADADGTGGGQAREEEPRPTFAGRRILLAEDVDINREIVITLLEDTGILIDSAENGRMACDMFAAAPDAYDLIFMDIHMPEMDGYEATKYIRAMAHPRAGTVPIIAMTANVFREDIEKCHALGMNDHVGKPLEMAEVLAKMRHYL